MQGESDESDDVPYVCYKKRTWADPEQKPFRYPCLPVTVSGSEARHTLI